MSRAFVVAGALLAALAVMLGAFGSHGLSAHFEAHPDLKPTFQTASEYHLVHAVALVVAGGIASRWPGRLSNWGGVLLATGIVLFSGSLYALSILNVRGMGAVAPFGGAALILGWLCLALAGWRGNRTP
ncbi:MAG: DUF423 domain-containing protein [Chloroflexota bacterium]|nr:MAG: DUF423 domain-containing protein [Chloroflexota bacterium]